MESSEKPHPCKNRKDGPPKFKDKEPPKLKGKESSNFKGTERQADCWDERWRWSETSESLPDFTS